MNVDMTKNLTYAFCNSDGGPAIAVQKRGSGAESFSGGLDHEYRVQIGLETWGDNNARGDIKVNNKVDNKVWGDTVNDTVKRPQIRTRTTTPYNTRTRPVQHPQQLSVKVWLTQEQMSLLFGRAPSVIVRHIFNTFKHIMEVA